jgi:hypothetical protein
MGILMDGAYLTGIVKDNDFSYITPPRPKERRRGGEENSEILAFYFSWKSYAQNCRFCLKTASKYILRTTHHTKQHTFITQTQYLNTYTTKIRGFL